MIVIFDSGIGGFEFLNNLIKNSSSATSTTQTQILYYSDSKNFPYGNKTYSELETIILSKLEEFKNLGATNIVISCNTASLITNKIISNNQYKGIQIFHTINILEEILKEFPNTTLLSTQLTKQNLKKQLKTANQIIAMPNLATAIEKQNIDQINAQINQLPRNLSSITYACTHFPLAHEQFSKIIKTQYINPINYLLKNFFKANTVINSIKLTFSEKEMKQKFIKKQSKNHNYLTTI